MPKLPTGRKPLVSRNVKVDEDIWELCKQLADQEGKTVSDVVRESLARYVRLNGARP